MLKFLSDWWRRVNQRKHRKLTLTRFHQDWVRYAYGLKTSHPYFDSDFVDLVNDYWTYYPVHRDGQWRINWEK